MEMTIECAKGTNLGKGKIFFYPSSEEEIEPEIISRIPGERWESGLACFEKETVTVFVPDEHCVFTFYSCRGRKDSFHVKHYPSCNRRCGAARQLRAESVGMEKCLYYYDLGVVMALSYRRLAGFAVLLTGEYCMESDCPRSNSEWDIPQRCWCYDAEALKKELKRRGLLPS